MKNTRQGKILIILVVITVFSLISAIMKYPFGVKIKEEYLMRDDIEATGLLKTDNNLYVSSNTYVANLEDEKARYQVSFDFNEDITGITEWNGKVIAITGKKGLAPILEITQAGDLKDTQTFLTYSYNAFGITNNGKNLIVSDNTSTLRVVDGNTLETIEEIKIKDENKKPLEGISEIAYNQDDGLIYALMLDSDTVYSIDLKEQKAIKSYDIAKLSYEKSTRGGYPSAISHIKENEFYILGRLWKHLYKVQLN